MSFPKGRPKRSASNNIDYSLKNRKIITEDIDPKPSTRLPNEAQTSQDIHERILPIIEREVGGELKFNEPKFTDPVNGATGLPLNAFPDEKVKKESLWNYRTSNGINNDNNIKEVVYKDGLKTKESSNLIKTSSLRSKILPYDIRSSDRSKLVTKNNSMVPVKKSLLSKIKTSKDKDSKLFGQNSTATHVHLPEIVNEMENDDFCSVCYQTGIFLCCDTCPKSFHFACYDPPLDPNNLPQGDWSCNECNFKKKNESKFILQQNEKTFLLENSGNAGYQLFGKLLFNIEQINPRQFQLLQSIKDTFLHIGTGPHGEYRDNNIKSPPNQAISKLDSYNPDMHFRADSTTLLQCYKCGESRMGIWDNPRDSRLIMSCDYCSTPWHLDCLPIPRASLKNLGSKWKCPLHSNSEKKRRLARNQRYVEVGLGFKNDGDIEVKLDETNDDVIGVSIPPSLKESWDLNSTFSIPEVKESNIKLEFLDKVYRAKKVARMDEIKHQFNLINSLIDNDLSAVMYFFLSKPQRKFWDLQELCHLANCEIIGQSIDSRELAQLKMLKRLLESKPKDEVMKFLGISE